MSAASGPILDDKSEHCIPFILERLKAHQEKNAGKDVPPFFVGVNGVQGAGKTTLVSALYTTLTSPPYSLPTAILSIDDLYLTHTDQQKLASTHKTNPLVQHRGQPSTHDLPLARTVFAAIKAQEPVKLPFYDKSAFNGAGDRASESEWRTVNDGPEKIKVVIFEGWCVGFRALGDEEVERKRVEAVQRTKSGGEKGELWKHSRESLGFVNEALRGYDDLTNSFNAFIHIDAEDTKYVYDWRLQQEAALRAAKGTGMSDEQVVDFVNGYYPAYELYTDTLRSGIFPGERGKQLRLVVGKNRKVVKVEKI